MRSIDIVLKGDPAGAREAATQILTDKKFRLDWKSEWAATAERGSRGKNIALGAFSQYFKVGLLIFTGDNGETIVRFNQESSGAAGGVIGMVRTRRNMQALRDELSGAFESHGLLVAVHDGK